MTAATSSVSKAMAMVLVPSWATWSTTLAPPIAPMASARSDLPLQPGVHVDDAVGDDDFRPTVSSRGASPHRDAEVL